MTDGSVISPCINVCVIDTDSGYCLGCCRTREEIEHWPEMSTDEQRALLERLARRRADSDSGD